MNYIVNQLEDLNVVEVVTSGMVDHNARKEIICAACALLNQSDCDKLLINKTNSSRFFDKQMSGALSIIKLMNELNFSTNAAIAVLHNQKEQYDEFFEVMAQLKGFSVKSFTSRDNAIAWLCQGDAEKSL